MPERPLPAILDMEASGFGRDSYPIEVGYVLPDGRTRCTLIRPAPHWVHWDPAAEQLHHIPRAAVRRLHHARAAPRHDREPHLREPRRHIARQRVVPVVLLEPR